VIYTASFGVLNIAQRFVPLRVLPVRIAKSAPRWWPQSQPLPYVEPLAPPGWVFGIKDDERARRGYRAHLYRQTVDRIGSMLDEVAERCEADVLALCCYEWDHRACHRSWLSEWWFDRTGEVWPDLSLLQGLEGGAALVYETTKGA
jgi:hypothetical protein